MFGSQIALGYIAFLMIFFGTFFIGAICSLPDAIKHGRGGAFVFGCGIATMLLFGTLLFLLVFNP